MKSGPLILPGLPPLALVKSSSLSLRDSPHPLLGFRLCWVRLKGRGFLKKISVIAVMFEWMLFKGRAAGMPGKGGLEFC